MNYTEEIARTTKDPKILTDILRREKNDYVSEFAASNPNCPPEMLVEILRRENSDDVSKYAANNPNCPPEMLVEILRRENDIVSWYAAKNPNCPPEILAEVLKRGKNNTVSCIAAKNPNCPYEARINWMLLTGKIGKEDPTKHIIEYEIIKQDDLQDLKDLLNNC